MSSALTHGRVRNSFRSGTEHIKKPGGVEILRRSLRPFPGLIRWTPNGFRGGGLMGLVTRRSYRNRNLKTMAAGRRKKALTVGTVGTSAAVKRRWAKY